MLFLLSDMYTQNIFWVYLFKGELPGRHFGGPAGDVLEEEDDAEGMEWLPRRMTATGNKMG